MSESVKVEGFSLRDRVTFAEKPVANGYRFSASLAEGAEIKEAWIMGFSALPESFPDSPFRRTEGSSGPWAEVMVRIDCVVKMTVPLADLRKVEAAE